MHRLALIWLIAGALIETPALAQDRGYKAMVEVSRHQISINRGEGYQQVDGITPVRPGDLVMASTPDGHGWINYPDCDVEVLSGKVYTVEHRPGVVQIRDAVGPRLICKTAVPYWLIGVGAAGLAAGICAAADCFGDDDDGRPTPASP